MSSELALIVLGSGAAFGPPDRDNTSLAVQSENALWLIDCAGSPWRRMRRAGLDPAGLSAIVITHAHPDHLYGLPSLLHCLIPVGLTRPLPILAPPRTLACIRDLLAAFSLLSRADLPLHLVALPAEPVLPPAEPVWSDSGVQLWTAPVEHTVETVGLRLAIAGRTVTCSSDTAPCEAVVELARDADLLVHEATFRSDDPGGVAPGHSTAAGAGQTAARAGAARLLLVHLLERTAADPAALQREAEEYFSGEVIVAEDLRRYCL